MRQVTENTSEAFASVEKLCQLLQSVPEPKRRIIAASMLAYMNGIDAGIALERGTKQAAV